MTNNYTTNAINIKSYNLSESDKIVVMYSKDYGIIRCVAKGIKKPKNKLSGRMDLLMDNSLIISKGRNLDVVCQADVLNSFKNIRKDIVKLSYSMYLTELIGVFGVENDMNSQNIYDLFTNTLQNLDAVVGKSNMLPVVIDFQLKLMELSGYAPELNRCVGCGCENLGRNSRISIRMGGAICSNCMEIQDDSNNNVVDALKNINDEKIDLNTLENCFNVLKDYISYRCHKKLKTIEFLESVV